jgi:hypothetical protein
MHHSIKTIKVTTAVAGLLVVAMLLANCKKEYSYEGGTAVFSLLNLNGTCTNPVISGDYIIGSTLGSWTELVFMPLVILRRRVIRR